MRETPVFTSADSSISSAPQKACSRAAPPCIIFLTASQTIQAAATKISSASTVPEAFSNFPCPKG